MNVFCSDKIAQYPQVLELSVHPDFMYCSRLSQRRLSTLEHCWYLFVLENKHIHLADMY